MTSYKLVDFKTLGDERGSLIAIEQGYNAPFQIKRVYYIFDTKEGVERGFHAHKNLKQIAIAVKGSCTFVLASEHYDEKDYIRDYNKFLEEVKNETCR
jgi:dTDP-4-dehydrorhamnose 3,5-epimerase-like enzyme